MEASIAKRETQTSPKGEVTIKSLQIFSIENDKLRRSDKTKRKSFDEQ